MLKLRLYRRRQSTNLELKPKFANPLVSLTGTYTLSLNDCIAEVGGHLDMTGTIYPTINVGFLKNAG